jgi:acylphosphatase
VSSRGDRVEAVVRGRVQGVGFRYYILRRASRLGLTGWVANEDDGSVRCVAEGPRPALDELVEMLRSGPPGARVDGVRTVYGTAGGGWDRFSVRATGHAGD